MLTRDDRVDATATIVPPFSMDETASVSVASTPAHSKPRRSPGRGIFFWRPGPAFPGRRWRRSSGAAGRDLQRYSLMSVIRTSAPRARAAWPTRLPIGPPPRTARAGGQVPGPGRGVDGHGDGLDSAPCSKEKERGRGRSCPLPSQTTPGHSPGLEAPDLQDVADVVVAAAAGRASPANFLRRRGDRSSRFQAGDAPASSSMTPENSWPARRIRREGCLPWLTWRPNADAMRRPDEGLSSAGLEFGDVPELDHPGLALWLVSWTAPAWIRPTILSATFYRCKPVLVSGRNYFQDRPRNPDFHPAPSAVGQA